MKHSSPSLKNKLFAFIAPLAALVLIFINPADPREQAKDNLVDTSTATMIHTNSADPQWIAYNRINDSLQKIVRWKKQRLRGMGSGWLVMFGGVITIDECDACVDANEKPTTSKHFISLDGFALKEDAGFRIEGNDYIIDKFVAARKIATGDAGHTEQVKVNVRLADRGHSRKGLTLLIPVSDSSYKIASVIVYILFALTLIAGLLLFIRLPIKLLINIARGKAFTKENISYLNWIGWGLIGSVLIMVAIPKLLQLLLSSKLGGAIYYPFWSSLFDSRWTIFAGIGILMLASAFKQGYQLQQEQDLTI